MICKDTKEDRKSSLFLLLLYKLTEAMYQFYNPNDDHDTKQNMTNSYS